MRPALSMDCAGVALINPVLAAGFEENVLGAEAYETGAASRAFTNLANTGKGLFEQ